MTDDELDRALRALPLEAVPIDLHARILGVTIARPSVLITTWEIWAVGTMLALIVWLAVMVETSIPDFGGAIGRALSRAVDLLGSSLSLNTLMWVALGASCAVWISLLSLPQIRRQSADR